MMLKVVVSALFTLVVVVLGCGDGGVMVVVWMVVKYGWW